jgi:hypothetical protein
MFFTVIPIPFRFSSDPAAVKAANMSRLLELLVVPTICGRMPGAQSNKGMQLPPS